MPYQDGKRKKCGVAVPSLGKMRSDLERNKKDKRQEIEGGGRE
jgi:hypothetical protein